MYPAELVAQRRQTRAYIGVDPVSIQLVRKTRVSDGAGGHTLVETTLDPQTARIILLSSRANVERRTEAGVIVVANASLTGYPGLDIEKYDKFSWRQGTCEVLFINPNRDWQISAEVLYSNASS